MERSKQIVWWPLRVEGIGLCVLGYHLHGKPEGEASNHLVFTSAQRAVYFLRRNKTLAKTSRANKQHSNYASLSDDVVVFSFGCVDMRSCGHAHSCKKTCTQMIASVRICIFAYVVIRCLINMVEHWIRCLCFCFVFLTLFPFAFSWFCFQFRCFVVHRMFFVLSFDLRF